MFEKRYRAIGVHLLTATGAVLALLAIEAASRHAWPVMMLWLVVAFVVDGIDGPLARKYDVKKNASEWDGVLMDLIIDYLTYVFIPAYALWQSGLMSHWWAGLFAAIICFSSVVYFADTRMKTADNSFAGFPGCWNMAVVILFAVAPPPWMIGLIVIALTVAMFLPVKFIHPVRTDRWRAVSLTVALAWTGLAFISAWQGFNEPMWIKTLLVLSSIYLLGAGAVQQLLPLKKV